MSLLIASGCRGSAKARRRRSMLAGIPMSMRRARRRSSTTRSPVTSGSKPSLALAFARLAEDVHRVGNTYTFQMEGEGNPEGEARVEDGYLVSLTVRYDLPLLDARAEEQHTLSNFGSDIRIEPPLAARSKTRFPRTAGSSPWTRDRLRTARPSRSRRARSLVFRPMPIAVLAKFRGEEIRFDRHTLTCMSSSIPSYAGQLDKP
jgi:hypothetical protein